METQNANELHRLLSDRFGLPPFQLFPLSGDASDRTFFRARFPEHQERFNASAIVVMAHHAPVDLEELPFLKVQSFLAANGLPVPRVFDAHESGVVLLSDAGDLTLEAALRAADAPGRLDLFRRAIDLMHRLQDATHRPGNGCPAFRLAFDEEKLMWEMDFFVEHVFESWLKSPLKKDERSELRERLSALCGELASLPRLLAHRDYHSRNIMVQADGSLLMVDFQDARMGPRQYDLVSLLRDSYSPIGNDDLEYLLYYDRFLLKKQHGDLLCWREYKERFNNMCAQRSLKACGSFAYLDAVKGKNRYLKHFGKAFQYAVKALASVKRHEAIGKMLSERLKGKIP